MWATRTASSAGAPARPCARAAWGACPATPRRPQLPRSRAVAGRGGRCRSGARAPGGDGGGGREAAAPSGGLNLANSLPEPLLSAHLPFPHACGSSVLRPWRSSGASPRS